MICLRIQRQTHFKQYIEARKTIQDSAYEHRNGSTTIHKFKATVIVRGKKDKSSGNKLYEFTWKLLLQQKKMSALQGQKVLST